jgi:hypothetical protein
MYDKMLLIIWTNRNPLQDFLDNLYVFLLITMSTPGTMVQSVLLKKQ